MGNTRSFLLIGRTTPPNQDGLLIGAALSRIGHDVRYHDYRTDPQENIVQMSREIRPDYIFVTKGPGVSRATYARAKSHAGKLVMWYPDAYLPEDKGYGCEFLEDVLPAFDLALINVRGLVQELSRWNPHCYFAPSFFDNHFYGVDSLSPSDYNTFSCDVTFIGNNQKVYTDRLRTLRAVAKNFDLKVWGLGWGLHVPRPLVELAKTGATGQQLQGSRRASLWLALQRSRPILPLTRFGRCVAGQELVDNSVSKAYRCSKLGLNAGTLRALGREDMDLGFSDRLYKCMGNGTPYLTPPIRNIEEWFSPGRDIVVYHSERELLSEIERLLEDEQERLRIGENGQRKILAHHTIDIRITQYLEMMERGVDVFGSWAPMEGED